MDDLQQLLPTGKDDVERARALIELGYPAVSQVLPSLLLWMQDYNWPVARELAPFLAALVPAIREVLQGNDGCWKYWVDETAEGVAAEAAEILRTLQHDSTL